MSIRKADLFVRQSRKKTTMLPQPTLYCEDCHEESSANPDDYFMLPDDYVFVCQCGENLRLVDRITVYRDVRKP